MMTLSAMSKDAHQFFMTLLFRLLVLLFCYFSTAFILYFILPYFGFKKFDQSKRLYPKREILLSLSALVIFSLGAAIVVLTHKFWGYPKIIGYPAAFNFKLKQSPGWRHSLLATQVYSWWFFQIIFILFSLMSVDFTFYWSHRLMHSRTLFPAVHSTHHQFTEPSAFCSYALHPFEATLLAMTLFVPHLLAPFNQLVWGVFLAFHVGWVGFIHSGFDSSAWAQHPILRYIYSPTHHLFHHREGESNYGLYFTFWDKIMGTEKREFVPAHKAD
jgi:sterol desaturase/sphingolipid hydroxylase (fatty acid hydroxylase superfamily)